VAGCGSERTGTMKISKITVVVSESVPDPAVPGSAYGRQVQLTHELDPAVEAGTLVYEQTVKGLEASARLRVDAMMEQEAAVRAKAAEERAAHGQARQILYAKRRQNRAGGLAPELQKMLDGIWAEHPDVKDRIEAEEAADDAAGVERCKVCGCTRQWPCAGRDPNSGMPVSCSMNKATGTCSACEQEAVERLKGK